MRLLLVRLVEYRIGLKAEHAELERYMDLLQSSWVKSVENSTGRILQPRCYSSGSDVNSSVRQLDQPDISMRVGSMQLERAIKQQDSGSRERRARVVFRLCWTRHCNTSSMGGLLLHDSESIDGSSSVDPFACVDGLVRHTPVVGQSLDLRTRARDEGHAADIASAESREY